ncbi:MAG: type II secretion system protein [Armatimonadota bacterium]|nr:type II secretion system protein [Armatimonadota bacterium]MDR7428147.1 type II secretion system protein [Armatimonadota bacterium]MDR7463705.1 type II secretion system protein [Armatimonadota bacterium]MDR7470973.1 type II secretion system protein [Armatimonadota bacterium]MDR7473630.1 type II secretion system protein [Armatimonadota bacterium]
MRGKVWFARGGTEGFSLVESAVAVGIVGLALALALSGRGLVYNRRLAGAARALGTDIRWVEQRARTERRCWRVVFDPGEESYAIQYLEGGRWTPSGGCRGSWSGYTSAPRRLPTGVDLQSTTFGGGILTVSPFGHPNAGTVLLRSPAGEQRRVTVNVGGRVTIAPQ